MTSKTVVTCQIGFLGLQFGCKAWLQNFAVFLPCQIGHVWNGAVCHAEPTALYRSPWSSAGVVHSARTSAGGEYMICNVSSVQRQHVHSICTVFVGGPMAPVLSLITRSRSQAHKRQATGGTSPPRSEPSDSSVADRGLDAFLWDVVGGRQTFARMHSDKCGSMDLRHSLSVTSSCIRDCLQ